MKDSFQSCLKWFFIHFIPVPGHAHSIQTGPGTSLCSCSGLSLPSRPHSLFLLTIPKQDQESLSAPCPYCLCQAGASSRSVGTMQTQDCYTWSWSCKSWIFYGSFTVRWGPTGHQKHSFALNNILITPAWPKCNAFNNPGLSTFGTRKREPLYIN